MNQVKTRQLNAATATVSYCESTAADTSAITAFAPVVALIKNKIVIVHNFNILGSTPITGINVNVKAVRESMEQHTYKLANAIFSFAAAQTPTDNDLMAQSKLSKGSLGRMSKNDCVDTCDRIQQLAAAHATGLVAYGIDAADITDAAAVVVLYRAATDDSREAQVSRSGANAQALATLKNIMDNLLTNQLDTMANTLRYSNNAWWNQYRAAREIIDPGAFTTVLKIYVTNKANNDPLMGAKSYRDNAPEFKKSTTKGFITYKDIEEGPHSFVLKHKLFEDLTIPSVMISHGKKHQITAKMKPLTNTSEPVLTSVTLEGDVAMGNIIDLDTSGFTVTDSTTVQIIVSGNELLFSAAPAAGPSMGATVWHVFLGTQNKTLEAFGALVGASDINTFLKVQCIGPVGGHYTITFNNVEVSGV